MNKKGSGISNLIIWIGILGSTALIIFYGMTKIEPRQLTLDYMYQDVNSLQSVFNKACVSDEIYVEFNPLSREGEIHINESGFCINSTSFEICKEFQCRFRNLEEVFNIKDFITLRIEKNHSSMGVFKNE